jgi:photosystem II stability/assembly factor-like uncharacterized protein
MSHICVGTDRGLLHLSDDGGTWRQTAHLLQDDEIFGLAECDGFVWAATRRNGLLSVNTASRVVKRVGSDALPEYIRCVARDPNDPRIVYVGCEPLAIYRSDDGGVTWRASAQLSQLYALRNWKFPAPSIQPHIRWIAVDRFNRGAVYAAAQVGGVLRSNDYGETWEDFDEGIDPDVHMLVQDLRDPSLIYAATGGGGYPDDPQGYPPALPRGRPLYRSTDRGESWECISAAFERHYGAPVCVHPSEPSLLLAGVARGIPPLWRGNSGSDAVVVASHDGGASWKQLSAGLPPYFTKMVEVIVCDDVGRIYVGIGGDSSKFGSQADARGDIYCANGVDETWHRVELELPLIYAILPM